MSTTLPITIIDISSSSDKERPPVPHDRNHRPATVNLPNLNTLRTHVNLPTADLQTAIRSVRAERLQDSVMKLCQHTPGATEFLADLLLTQPKPSKDASSGAKRKVVTRYATCQNCEEEFDVLNNNDKKGCVYHDGPLYSPISLMTAIQLANPVALSADAMSLDYLVPLYDSIIWADTDEDYHGPIDTEENKQQFPEGFEWSCCGTNGADSYKHEDVSSDGEDADEDPEDRVARLGRGCCLGRHVELDNKQKRRRY